MLKQFIKDENGQGMVEYGLIVALIAIVVIVALKALGGSIESIFNKASKELEEVAPTGGEGEVVDE